MGIRLNLNIFKKQGPEIRTAEDQARKAAEQRIMDEMEQAGPATFIPETPSDALNGVIKNKGKENVTPDTFGKLVDTWKDITEDQTGLHKTVDASDTGKRTPEQLGQLADELRESEHRRLGLD